MLLEAATEFFYAVRDEDKARDEFERKYDDLSSEEREQSKKYLEKLRIDKAKAGCALVDLLNAGWGEGVINSISQDLTAALPGVKGLSPTNLGYAKRFYSLYSQLDTFYPQLVGKTKYEQLKSIIFRIPWGHQRYLIDKFYNNPKRAFYYVRLTLENGWSRAVLLNAIDLDLKEPEGKAVTNFSLTLPKGDLAQEMTKDPYLFDFAALTKPYKEEELKRALMKNIEQFLLELGTGFAFMGREYRLIVGSTEQFIDMLFYNTRLRCYVVIEVKAVKFQPGDVGQLGTYVSAVNHILKTPADNPTIGLLICKTKDNVLAQYALESSSQPIGISEYELSKVYPADFKSTLPSIEDIENELKDKQ